ncbi:MAG: hypothetical protein J5637_00640 [Prevotella sp.]|nr:hypothetical protein [Prevotella sp.]
MEKGYIALPRTIFISEEWLQPRVFSMVEAWVDIVASVRFSTQPTTITVSGKTVVWQKDCWPVSLRTLAKRWQWTVRGVRSFLSLMAQKDMITLTVENGITIIRVIGDATAVGTGNGTADGTRNGTAGETAPTESKETEMKFDTVANALKDNEKDEVEMVETTMPTKPAHCDVATPQGTPCGTASDTASGTIQNKGLIEERINLNDDNACVRVREEMREMSRSNLWREVVCMRHHLTPEQLNTYLESFVIDSIASGRQGHDSIADAKAHFNHWLRIQLQQNTFNNHCHHEHHTKHTAAEYIRDAQQWGIEQSEAFIQEANRRHGGHQDHLPF